MEDKINPPEAQPQKVDPKEVPLLWWLSSVEIYYEVGGVTRSRKVNVVLNTFVQYVNSKTLGNIQKTAQVQVMQYEKIPKKAKIVDVVIISTSLLGQMTENQFNQVRPDQELGDEPAATVET